MEPNHPIQLLSPSTMPPQPTDMPSSAPPPSKSPIILLFFISLLSLGGLIFYYFQNHSLKLKLATEPSPTTSIQNSPVPSPMANANTDWQEYTNDKLGFSIKLPVDFVPEKSNSGLNIVGAEGMFVMSISDKLTPFGSMRTCPLRNVTKIPCVFSTFDGTKEIRQETIGGNPAISFRYWVSAGEYHTVYQTLKTPYIQVEFNGQVYREELGSEGTKERDLILSTLQFTDSQ